ncbi:hypothetical protein [Tomitella gaofuii]|uniref:hypothetical protein n=1 Tax=Tomitella gaofuii TaxID=2760083 RepID=UPI0015F86432|nr:hypothetical protein [Tomitella gaofuii]
MDSTVREDEFDARSGNRVRTRTMAEYLTDHPLKGMFPPTSELTTRVVMVISYLLILAAIIYIVVRAV